MENEPQFTSENLRPVHQNKVKEMGVPEWNINMLISLTRVVKLGMIGNVTHAIEHITGKPARNFADFAAEHAVVWK